MKSEFTCLSLDMNWSEVYSIANEFTNGSFKQSKLISLHPELLLVLTSLKRPRSHLKRHFPRVFSLGRNKRIAPLVFSGALIEVNRISRIYFKSDYSPKIIEVYVPFWYKWSFTCYKPYHQTEFCPIIPGMELWAMRRTYPLESDFTALGACFPATVILYNWREKRHTHAAVTSDLSRLLPPYSPRVQLTRKSRYWSCFPHSSSSTGVFVSTSGQIADDRNLDVDRDRMLCMPSSRVVVKWKRGNSQKGELREVPDRWCAIRNAPLLIDARVYAPPRMPFFSRV